jgi:hypothetical protein
MSMKCVRFFEKVAFQPNQIQWIKRQIDFKFRKQLRYKKLVPTGGLYCFRKNIKIYLYSLIYIYIRLYTLIYIYMHLYTFMYISIHF